MTNQNFSANSQESQNASHLVNKIETFHLQSVENLRTYPVIAEKNCMDAAILLQDAPENPIFSSLRAENYLLYGNIQKWQACYNQALLSYLHSFEIQEQLSDKYRQAILLQKTGTCYQAIGNYPESISSFMQAMLLFLDLEKNMDEIITLREIGTTYLLLRQYTKAFNVVNDSLSYSLQLNHPFQEALSRELLANIYITLGDFKNADKNIEISQNILRQLDDNETRVRSFNLQAYYAFRKKRYAETIRYLSSAKEICQEIGYIEGETRVYLLSARANNELDETDLALADISYAVSIAKISNTKPILYRAYRTLSEIYRKKSDYAKAFLYFEKYSQLRSQIFNVHTGTWLSEVENKNYSLLGSNSDTYREKYLSLQQEINQREVIEEALKNSNRQLQEEIIAREQLIMDLNAFTHMVAHDLKSPLQNILTAAVLFGNSAMEKLDAGEQGLLRGILRMVDSMSRIINELLVLASIREEEITFDNLDTKAILEEVENRLSHLILDHKAEIIKPKSWPVAYGYTPWVEEIWMNYISNAIKYGGDPPIVELGAIEEFGITKFWIKDNGNGLEPYQQKELYTRFRRLDTVRASGHGLGLSIIKRIVEKLGGEVFFESPGAGEEGSIFGFTLPSIKPEESAHKKTIGE
ncbi:MAG: tetratricopeptide repeat protein [Anaerolineales bacterium]|nr:tetratricopeptide repeat protein [Anaerolineales bacterium]